MTLGGLALAVGILVDDATVEIENIHRNMAQRKPLLQAILDGARQIAVPAFVSTLCICIVFVPVVFLTGAARYLFTPLALAVVLAMMASYLLSRTLVPTMVQVPACRRSGTLPRRGGRIGQHGAADLSCASTTRFNAMVRAPCASGYRRLLAAALAHRKAGGRRALSLLCAGCCALLPFVGEDFFPQVDAGQIRLHVRAPAGTRIEETEQLLRAGGGRHPPGRFRAASSPTSSTTSACPTAASTWPISDSATHRPVRRRDPGLARARRTRLPPGTTCASCAGGSTAQFPRPDVLLPARRHRQPDPEFRPARPDRRAGRRDRWRNASGQSRARAPDRANACERIPGAVDVHLHQVVDAPELRFDVDRTRARQVGLTQRDVANSLLISLSLQHADRAQLLDQPAEQRGLPDRRADAASTAWIPPRSCCSTPHPRRRRRTSRSC